MFCITNNIHATSFCFPLTSLKSHQPAYKEYKSVPPQCGYIITDLTASPPPLWHDLEFQNPIILCLKNTLNGQMYWDA